MPPKTTKNAQPKTEATEPVQEVVTSDAPAPSTPAPPSSPSTKGNRASKAKAPVKPRTTKPKASKANTPVEDGSTSEEKSPAEKKLSAVPMPLVKKVKEQLGSDVTLKNMSELKTILETFIEVIVDTVAKGDSVTLPNVMTFKRVLRKERTHMNPKTMDPIVKPAHYVFSMYVKARLKKEFESLEVSEADTMPKQTKKDAPVTAQEDKPQDQTIA